MLTKAKARAGSLTDAGVGKVTELADAGKEAAKAVVDRVEDRIVDRAISWTEEKVTAATGSAVEKAGVRIKEGMRSDHQIPHFIANVFCDLVDSLLPDVREEIVYTVMGQVYARQSSSEEVEVVESRGGFRRAVGCLRGAVLYHLQPFDNGGGGRLTDVWWWIFTLPAICPVLGVQQMWFFLLFLLIDKGDEFQLCSFILNFKGMQALTIGIIGVIVGAVRYALCVNKSPPTCETDAPGMSRFFFLELAAFSGQIFLVWGAFLLLPCSDKKGADARAQDAAARAAATGSGAGPPSASSRCCCCMVSTERGGRLRNWLVFDTLIFVLACGLVGAAVAVKGGAVLEADWKFRQTLYWGKVLYGMLSVPYLLFSLPLAKRLFTHARPTGYDKHGRLRACRARDSEADNGP